MKIRDITQRDGLNFIRFSVLEYDGKIALIISKKSFREEYGEQLRVETSPKRAQQLANEILSYLNKEAKIKEWTPTMADFETKLRERWNEKQHHVELWFIDWVRFPEKNRKIQARKIYEWLHINKDWLYRDD